MTACLSFGLTKALNFFFFAFIMMLLKNKTALITGGTRGIGHAIAKKFAEQGCHIAFTFIANTDRARQTEDELKVLGIKAKSYCCNGASYSAVEELVEEVIKDFGSIDVLVNNAGITRDNLILRMSEEQWDEVMNTNLKSVFNFTKHVSKIMLKQKYGSIINLTSIVGERGQAGQANYAASKAGIIGFTKSVADEFGSRNIRCNAISPGFIETDMTDILSGEQKKNILQQIPIKRMGSAEEVANAALFLAGNLSTYVSGQVISVCGGMNR
jgi:3-oxoacyl-[acyl-carrier protein] reductase